MESRSTKYRSVDSKPSELPPRTRERHNSVPTTDRRKDHHHRRPSTVAKAPDAGHRTTKSQGRGESLISPDRPSGTRHQDRHRATEATLEARLPSKVRKASRPFSPVTSLARHSALSPAYSVRSPFVDTCLSVVKQSGFELVHQLVGAGNTQRW
jgi:hypothetical protein